MAPTPLTVLAAIRRGEEATLGGMLRAIGDDINGRRSVPGERPHIDFRRCRRVHFARLAILTDPDRGPGCMRLLFASVYDGDLDAHLAELAAATSDMDAIWGKCAGYAGAASFGAFVRAHTQDVEAFYAAFPDETAASIADAVRATRASPPALESGRATDDLVESILSVWRRVVRATPLASDLVRAISRFGFTGVYRATSKIVASLDRIPAFRLFNWITHNRLPPRSSLYSSVTLDNCASVAPLVPGDELPGVAGALPPPLREDLVAQNELTLITVVQRGQVDRVRAALAAIDSYARRLAPRGSLIGVGTIHFVRWVVLDEGRRLVLLSDYDNSWESYIDEFAEMILSGLDAIWGSSLGYPPDGARDVPALKRFLRTHQVRAEVFYSAYPDDTVLNILQATSTAASRREG